MDEITPSADSGAVATEAEPSFNMDSAVDQIASSMYPEAPASTDDSAEAQVDTAIDAAPTEPVAPTVRPAPKAWPKEMHDHWGKVDPAVQDYLEKREHQMVEGLSQYTDDAKYGKSLKEAIAPFEQIMKQYRLEPHQAVQSLFNAQVRLTQGSMETRRAAYAELGKNLGLTAPTGNGSEQAQMDPALQTIQQEVQSLKQSLTQREQADYHAAQERVNKEVEAFAADSKAHPYFNEVADTIASLLKGNVVSTLQEAYENAVRMNPVTYAKEMATAQQAEVEKQKENARLNALKAKTAASANVRTRESKRTPTEPTETMEDAIKSTFREIKSRART